MATLAKCQQLCGQELSEAPRPRPTPSPCQQLHYRPRPSPTPTCSPPALPRGSASLKGLGAVSSPFSAVGEVWAVGTASWCLVPPAAPGLLSVPWARRPTAKSSSCPPPPPPPAALGARGGGEGQAQIPQSTDKMGKGTCLLGPSGLGSSAPRNLGSRPVPRLALGLRPSREGQNPGWEGSLARGWGQAQLWR